MKKGYVIRNIGTMYMCFDSPVSALRGDDMRKIPTRTDAYLIIIDGRVVDYGSMAKFCVAVSAIAENIVSQCEDIDAHGAIVMPAFCDSHTHIVYSGSREGEFVDKINGLSYVEIAQRGGGILASAERLAKASEEELFEEAIQRVEECIGFGTGAMEIKSGYGLSTVSEIKMLRVIDKIKKSAPIAIKSTYLGAHAIPARYAGDGDAYVDEIIDETLPAVAAEGLADYVDVFCDKGFFTVPQTLRILDAASKYGMRPKIHANELALSGGIEAGVSRKALSVDHLEFTGDSQIALLAGSNTVATLLPGAALFLGMQYPPAREMIAGGVTVSLASDYNPGSSPSGNMKFVMSLASIAMKMAPEETLAAATVNGAKAMGLEGYGTICKGALANIIITKPISSLAFFTYAYTSNLIYKVLLSK